MGGAPISLKDRVKLEYTLEEAVNLMKLYPNENITWRSVKTDSIVSIGYND